MLNSMSSFIRKLKYEQIRKLMKNDQNKIIDMNAPTKYLAVNFRITNSNKRTGILFSLYFCTQFKSNSKTHCKYKIVTNRFFAIIRIFQYSNF